MTSRRVLVTGGPVHAHLDSIKILTNKFKGGRMVELANALAACGHEVVYLTADYLPPPVVGPNVVVLRHKGFNDYREQVLRQAQQSTAVVLGAAVANLIPVSPWEGKFPSHDYKPGDHINIPFMIAPRVIDEVRIAAPGTQVFGFKLLDGASKEELLRAAHEVCVSSRAVNIFANLRDNLDLKYVVNMEGGHYETHSEGLAEVIHACLEDRYYHTRVVTPTCDLSSRNEGSAVHAAAQRCATYAIRYVSDFVPDASGLMFGTIASRCITPPDSGVVSFVTTTRGKTKLQSWTQVLGVDHDHLEVRVAGAKATLNAPLLHNIFSAAPNVHTIVHLHKTNTRLPYRAWAPPGTLRDSRYFLPTSFEIVGHGVYLLFEDGQHEPIGTEYLEHLKEDLFR